MKLFTSPVATRQTTVYGALNEVTSRDCLRLCHVMHHLGHFSHNFSNVNALIYA